MAISLPPFVPSAAVAVILYAVYHIYWELTTGASRRRMIAQYGCKPINVYPDGDPTGSGLRLVLDSMRRFKEHRLLEGIKDRFAMMGVNTYQLTVSFRKIWTTIEPENLKSFQALDFKNWSIGENRKRLFIPFLGKGVFTTDGKEWAHSREMLRPNFVRSQVGDIATFEHHIQDLIDAIPRDGSTVDLQDLFFRLTMDSATDFLFGESTNCLKPGLSTVSASKFASAFTGCQEAISLATRIGFLGDLMPKFQYKKDKAFVHKFADDIVTRALANRDEIKRNPHKDGRYVFLHELICQTSDQYQIRSELLNILLAGRDTTASLLSNVWFILSKRPDIYAKLRAEVDELHGEKPGFEKLKEMKYLRAIMNESLRLHPVVPANSRQAIADTVLPKGGGKDGRSPLFVPKGQVVSWSTYVMHRRKDIYGDDAEEFVPDRWLGGKALRQGWEYLPFNGGPRVCLGQQFALTEATYTTVRLVQEFKNLESRDDGDWEEFITFTCTTRKCDVAMVP